MPWAALRAFADPSVGFGFRLQPPDAGGRSRTRAPRDRRDRRRPGDGQEPVPSRGPGQPADARTERRTDNVVDFGAFRRRSDSGPDD